MGKELEHNHILFVSFDQLYHVVTAVSKIIMMFHFLRYYKRTLKVVFIYLIHVLTLQ